jgi:hypothetical protein
MFHFVNIFFSNKEQPNKDLTVQYFFEHVKYDPKAGRDIIFFILISILFLKLISLIF